MRKKIYTLMVCLMAGYAVSKAQVDSLHPSIKSFSLKYEDVKTGGFSLSMDSTVTLIYILTVKDTMAINKIHVRISSGNLISGNLLIADYPIHSQPIVNAQGQTVFRRMKDEIVIRTINTTQATDNNFEVYTEDFQGQLSPVLNWEK